MAPAPLFSSLSKSTTLDSVHRQNKPPFHTNKISSMNILAKTALLGPKYHLSFLSFAVGFLLVWTCVISAILLSDSLNNKRMAEDAEVIFNAHHDVSNILFSFGHEMVSTVDLFLAMNETPQRFDLSTLEITWRTSDTMYNQVINSNHLWLRDYLIEPYIKWQEFRRRVAVYEPDVRDSVSLYLMFSSHLERHYQKFTPSSVHYTNGSPVKSPFINSGISFSLFNSGLYMKLAEIALGAIYTRTSLPINHTEYLELQFTSHALMEAAFQFHPQTLTKYHAFKSQASSQECFSAVRRHMLDGGKNSTQLTCYIEAIRDEISNLFLAKDLMVTTMLNQVRFLSQSSNNTFWLYLCFIIVAILAVLSCLALLCCGFRSLKTTHPPRERIIYKANTFHQNRQKNELRSRSQTLPIETIFNPFNIGMPVDTNGRSSTLNSSSAATTTSSNIQSNQLQQHQRLSHYNIPTAVSQSPFNLTPDKPRCFL